MIETPPDLFDEWMAQPLGLPEDQGDFVVRRAADADFEAVWDCVDDAFGRKRPRALYEWMYRDNPFGRARCWIVEEKATGRCLKTGAYFPWPIWRGDEVLRGSLVGDAATVADWQRKGLSKLRRDVRRSHPWARTIASIAGPNEGSRTVTKKSGEVSTIHGPLRGGLLILRGAPLAERAGIPRALARPLGGLFSAALGAWTRTALRRAGRPEFVEIDRFDASIDAVTLATMHFPLYWCPHNADFLNWRYLAHPTEDYVAHALVEDDRPVAYAVLRLDRGEATLAEFAASPVHARDLMAGVVGIAREADAAFVNFFATPQWRHWGLMRRVGFLPYVTKNYLDASYWPRLEDSGAMDRWQVTPGDRDYR